MRWPDLLSGVDVLERTGDSSPIVESVTQDDRRVGPGACFVCVRGSRHDGHDRAPAAVHAGAVALVVDHLVVTEPSVPQAVVRDTRAAVGPLAARIHRDPSAAFPLIGVTGTNGKTTTVHLLECIGRNAGKRTAIIGTTGARIGDRDVEGAYTTPPAEDLQALFAQMRAADVEWAAMEVSSHALVQRRVDGTHFAAVAFTNLTHDHLDFHGTLAEYLDAKAMLFDRRFATRAAVGVDGDAGTELATRARGAGLEVWTVAVDPSRDRPRTDVTVQVTNLQPDRTEFELATPMGTAPVMSRLVGRFNVENSAVAAAAALLAGVAFDEVVGGLSAPVVVPGRLERVDAGQPFTVLVDYAHTPDALERVLIEARRLAGDAHVLAVFGCGGDRDREKRPVMGRVAGSLADQAWITDDNPRTEDPDVIVAEIERGIARTNARYTIERDRRTAIAAAIATAAPGDVVVIAGKGHESGQDVNGVVSEFDDRVVARAALEAVA